MEIPHQARFPGSIQKISRYFSTRDGNPTTGTLDSPDSWLVGWEWWRQWGVASFLAQMKSSLRDGVPYEKCLEGAHGPLWEALLLREGSGQGKACTACKATFKSEREQAYENMLDLLYFAV